MSELADDGLVVYLWATLAWVDQLAQEYRDHETSPERKEELRETFRELYDFLTEIRQDE